MKKWQQLAERATGRAGKLIDGHSHVHAGEMVWWSTCGSLADKKANGMGWYAEEPLFADDAMVVFGGSFRN